MFNPLELVGWTGTIDALGSLAIALKIWLTYRKSRNAAHLYFTLFYLYLGLFFLMFATPQLFFDSGIIVAIGSVLGYFFLYLGLAYLMGFPYLLTDRRDDAILVFRLMIVYNVIFFLLRIVFFEPSVREIFPSYVYWRSVFPGWLRVMTGIIGCTATGSAAYMLFGYAFQHKEDKFLYYKTLWLASGSSLLVIASLLGFIAAPTGSAPFVIAATFLVLAGLVITFRGVLYQPPKVLEI